MARLFGQHMHVVPKARLTSPMDKLPFWHWWRILKFEWDLHSKLTKCQPLIAFSQLDTWAKKERCRNTLFVGCDELDPRRAWFCSCCNLRRISAVNEMFFETQRTVRHCQQTLGESHIERERERERKCLCECWVLALPTRLSLTNGPVLWLFMWMICVPDVSFSCALMNLFLAWENWKQ